MRSNSSVAVKMNCEGASYSLSIEHVNVNFDNEILTHSLELILFILSVNFI